MTLRNVEVQDRRGFMPILVSGVIISLSGLGWILYGGDAVTRAGLLCIGAIVWYTTEQTSRPPPNDPSRFCEFCEKIRAQTTRPPVLVCLGDSLTHGRCSANVPDAIVPALCTKLELPSSRNSTNTFNLESPLLVVNAGQNSIVSWTVLQERVDRVLACSPDYVMVMIGTNDLRAIYNRRWSWEMVHMWGLPQEPSFEELERNIKGIIKRLLQHDTVKNVGVCTLPPMGEDLTNSANQIVKRANAIIEKVVAQEKDSRCTVLPVYEALAREILKKPGTTNIPVDYFFLMALIMGAMYHFFGVCWNTMSRWFGNVVLSDSLHLNEGGRDIVVNVIVEWLTKIGIKQAIGQNEGRQ